MPDYVFILMEDYIFSRRSTKKACALSVLIQQNSAKVCTKVCAGKKCL